MASKQDLKDWVLEALLTEGGASDVVSIAKRIWQAHEHDLRLSGDLFFTWQYDMRWAAHALRKEGKLKSVNDKALPWELA